MERQADYKAGGECVLPQSDSALVHEAYVSLGSNWHDSDRRLEEAALALASLPHARLAALSPLYRTEPQDDPDQPWFANQAAKMRLGRAWTPESFLAALLALEKKLGRRRDPLRRSGPRAIDLDLLLFDDERRDLPECRLPHPRMLRRAFVLAPLRDIAPGLRPGGRSIDAWLGELPWRMEQDKIFQDQR